MNRLIKAIEFFGVRRKDSQYMDSTASPSSTIKLLIAKQPTIHVLLYKSIDMT